LENLNTQADEQKVNIGTFKEMKTRFGSKSAAFAYLLFILIYMPCVAAIAAVYRETNLKWAIFSVLYLTILAWIISTLFYQASMFAIQPAISTMWIFGLVIISIATYLVMKIKSKNIEISA
jgi:ferrous iron transport protein B